MCVCVRARLDIGEDDQGLEQGLELCLCCARTGTLGASSTVARSANRALPDRHSRKTRTKPSRWATRLPYPPAHPPAPTPPALEFDRFHRCPARLPVVHGQCARAVRAGPPGSPHRSWCVLLCPPLLLSPQTKDSCANALHKSSATDREVCKTKLNAAKATLAEINRRLHTDHSYTFFGTNAAVQAHLLEKYPGPALSFPAFYTHRGAVTWELLTYVTETMRTSVGPSQLEETIAAMRAKGRADDLLRYYHYQRHFASKAKAEGKEVPETYVYV